MTNHHSQEVPRTRPVGQLPEPAHFWVTHAPRSWRAAGGWWIHLAEGRLQGAPGKKAVDALPEMDLEDLDGLLYLPPVAPALSKERNRQATSWAESGISVLAQLRVGEVLDVPGITVVYDLTEPLLAGEPKRFSALPEGSWGVWPLIAGLTDLPHLWEDALDEMKAAGVRGIQAVTPEMIPAQRRALAEGQDEEVFEALFHGKDPSERTISREVHEMGLEIFLPRPDTGTTPRQLRNRRLGAILALSGELWLRLGRPPAAGQSFFRAARGAEGTSYDLAALVAEGNLGVMDWLDQRACEVIAEVLKNGRSALYDELILEYLGD